MVGPSNKPWKINYQNNNISLWLVRMRRIEFVQFDFFFENFGSIFKKLNIKF